MEAQNPWYGALGRNAGKDAFGAMYDKYYPLVYNFAYARLVRREAAEDVTSSVFLTAAENFWRFDAARGDFKVWILVIARNTIRNYLKRASVRHEVCVPQVPEPPFEEEAADDSFDAPANRAARRILSALSQEERDFLAMRYAADMTNSEIAASLGISENAVSSRFSRLLAKCRRLASGGASGKRGDESHDGQQGHGHGE